jgi:hypothetical protein
VSHGWKEYCKTVDGLGRRSISTIALRPNGDERMRQKGALERRLGLPRVPSATLKQ